jgi:hypothetical protein
MHRLILLDEDQLSAYRPIRRAIRDAALAGIIETWQCDLTLHCVRVALTSGSSYGSDYSWRICLELLAQVLEAAGEVLPDALNDPRLATLASIVRENDDLLSEASSSIFDRLRIRNGLRKQILVIHAADGHRICAGLRRSSARGRSKT